MRLNEFQAHVVRAEPISGMIEQNIADAVEKSVGELLVSAARLAQAAGTDLDSIAFAALSRMGKAPAVAGYPPAVAEPDAP